MRRALVQPGRCNFPELVVHGQRRRRRWGLTFSTALLPFVVACTAPDPAGPATSPTDTLPPPVIREMRGLWIATVANIDWPRSSAMPASEQRAALAAVIDRAADVGINTIVLQVRPAGDAVYESALEPWASLLTGTQGAHPGYDPLAFAIERAHARGLELHAWINPFRAGNAADTSRFAPGHLFRTRRDLVRVYGSQVWMDPGEPDVQDHTMRVVADIVRRYDVDAVHADDYFYPYVVNDASGRPIPFPDSTTYAARGAGAALDDWRRANVDRFVERLARDVHAIKPSLKVGISPFGIWRPNNPPGIQGLDAYATIYADARKWLMEGWVDYLAPQLYWAIAAPQQSFPLLLDWWMAQNPRGRHVWPGLAAYRVLNGTTSAFGMQEIPQQIRLTRIRPSGTGHLLYNTTWTLERNGGALADSLRLALYGGQALVPASPWLDPVAPPPPVIALRGDTLRLTPGAGEPPRWFVVRSRTSTGWSTRVVFHTGTVLTGMAGVQRVLTQSVDAAGNASAVAELRLP